MSTQTASSASKAAAAKKEVAHFLGEMFSFNSCLKLIHWSVTGPGSYAAHMALDQAGHTLRDATDSLVETTIASLGDLDIVVPETKKPANYVKYIEGFYDHVEGNRHLFNEQFTQSIFDDYQEGVKQLLYRLKRLQ
ncbi:DUF5856 family protein [Chitinophaga lutea]